MPTPADAPLRKVTLNLYEADVQIAERILGHGWSTELRDQFHKWMQTQKMIVPHRKTLGDLDQ